MLDRDSSANQLTVITSLVTKIMILKSYAVGFDVDAIPSKKIFSNETVSIDPPVLVSEQFQPVILFLQNGPKSKALKRPQKTIFRRRHSSWNVDRDCC